MKKKCFVFTMLMLGALSFASAQNNGKYVSEKWCDNMFIGVGGGVQGCMNSDNFDYGIWKTMNPVITLQVGKLINPVWGMRAEAAGWWTTLYTKKGQPAGEYLKIKDKKYVNVQADLLYNISNSLFGYNPDRFFTMTLFAGPGLTFAKAFGDQRTVNALVNGSVGFMGSFRLSRLFDVFIQARGMLSPSRFGDFSDSDQEGYISGTAGLIYTIGGKKFIPVTGDLNIDAINGEMNIYRQNLENTEAKLRDVELQLDKVTREHAEAHGNTTMPYPTVNNNANVVEVAGPRAIFFKIGHSDIDDYGMVNIKLAAKIMNAYPSKVYKIAGYADEATGTPERNKQLSTERAQNVYNALLNEGVSANQMQMVSEGGTANMFGKDFLNRVTIME